MHKCISKFIFYNTEHGYWNTWLINKGVTDGENKRQSCVITYLLCVNY